MSMWSLAIATAAVLIQATSACKTFGIDFVDDGSYFINSQSSDPFTALTKFEGCTGLASVILTPPEGDPILCNDIPSMQPDNTPMTITCPILKNQMSSGEWTLGILANNGDGAPLGIERNLHITAGPQATETITPTVTLSVTETPTVTSISTITDYDSTTLIPATVTSLKSGAKTQTVTSKPSRVTITKTSSTTVKSTSTSFTWAITTTTVDLMCALSYASSSQAPDPPADPTFLSMASAFIASAKATATAVPAPARRLRVRSDSIKVAQVARRYPAPIVKRAPDFPTTTITDSNTADWSTVFSSFTAPPTTVNGYTLVEITNTVTPAPVTVVATKTTITVTGKTSTRTITNRTTITNVSTKTKTATYTNTAVHPCK